METVCQVAFNLLSGEEVRRTEAILREYLLRVSDQVCLQKIGSSSVSLFSLRPKFLGNRKFKKELGEGDVAATGEHEWTFNLTDKIKFMLNRTSLFITGSQKYFFGFTDPKFLHHGNELAYLIVNEKIMNLYIPDSDKAELSAKGIYLDSPEV